MQQILKLTSKEKTQDMSAQSWWKKNKRRNPVKYDIQRIFDKSGLNKDSLKWYYPDSRTRERNKASTSSTTTMKSASEESAMLRRETTLETTTGSITTSSILGTCFMSVSKKF